MVFPFARDFLSWCPLSRGTGWMIDTPSTRSKSMRIPIMVPETKGRSLEEIQHDLRMKHTLALITTLLASSWIHAAPEGAVDRSAQGAAKPGAGGGAPSVGNDSDGG
ncbi:MAG: hypothetical protein B9S38_12225 [Verrucomicrobiia bacterium Tous-C4TDCM]|nr:MAG: hypothetical protein B9S38_12225 [Verrucomicrobiae bacterium Tous-C4TDCM]